MEEVALRLLVTSPSLASPHVVGLQLKTAFKPEFYAASESPALSGHLLCVQGTSLSTGFGLLSLVRRLIQ